MDKSNTSQMCSDLSSFSKPWYHLSKKESLGTAWHSPKKFRDLSMQINLNFQFPGSFINVLRTQNSPTQTSKLQNPIHNSLSHVSLSPLIKPISFFFWFFISKTHQTFCHRNVREASPRQWLLQRRSGAHKDRAEARSLTFSIGKARTHWQGQNPPSPSNAQSEMAENEETRRSASEARRRSTAGF